MPPPASISAPCRAWSPGNCSPASPSATPPRPERKYFYEQFEKYIVGFSNRLVVTPGLTGYAQVNGGYELAPEEKIVYDMEYIARRSIRLDLQCIVKTALLIFTHDGAR